MTDTHQEERPAAEPAGAPAEEHGRPQSRGLKLAIGLNTGVALALALLLGGLLNYLGYRHYRRADLSRTQMYQLSDKTKSLLHSLTNAIDVVVFFQARQDIYEDVDNLLKEYQYASKLIRIQQVDPDRDLARTELLAKKYQVDQPNVVVFDHGGRVKHVTVDDIVEMDYSGMMSGQPARRVAFKGEQAFSSAIQNVTQARRPTVYFLAGHGERDPDSFDRRNGYSTLAKDIRGDNVEIRKLNLGEKQVVPADADLLVIAGPQKRLASAEVDRLRQFIGEKGRVLCLLDSITQPGLALLLKDWGVQVGDDVVVDPTRTQSGQELFLTEYEAHPVTDKLRGNVSILYLPRSVEAVGGAEASAESLPDKPRVTVLAKCTAGGWAETRTDQNPMRYDPGEDRKGPVGVAAAVEKGAAGGIDVQIKPVRLVVFGDSDFLSNGALAGGNADFFLSAMNWLLDRKELMAIAPKPVEELRLMLDRRQLRLLGWCVIAGLPGLVAAWGVLVWLRRRA
ncbi:MAG: GldG family protein [Kiritimatiellaeota bacterium]|nr:GldG family protein [Kiritimatiellota bacterium]